MHVLFDHQSFSRQAVGGVSRSFVELARALNQESGVSARIFAPLHWNNYLRQPENRGFCSGFYQKKAVFRLWNQRWWLNHMLTGAVCAMNPPDVVHETWYSEHRCPLRRQTRVVTTVHDMIYQVHPEWTDNSVERSRELASSIDRADAILCVSEFTRNDLLNWRPSLDASRVFVVHHGVSDLGKSASEASAPSLPPSLLNASPFFLFVGQRSSSNKNFSFLARAFAASGLQGDFCLVCFGGGPFSGAEKSLFSSLGLGEAQTFQITSNDHVLRKLYETATALCYPSTYEGFGMPVLEAMSYSCPVVCSNATCLPEVAGDAALYFSPLDRDDLVHAMRRVAGEESLRRVLSARGRERAACFTWQSAARKAIGAYRAIL